MWVRPPVICTISFIGLPSFFAFCFELFACTHNYVNHQSNSTTPLSPSLILTGTFQVSMVIIIYTNNLLLMIYTRCVMIIHLPVKRSALQISTIIAYAKPSIKLINTANLNVLWLPIITLFDHIYSFTDDAFQFPFIVN